MKRDISFENIVIDSGINAPNVYAPIIPDPAYETAVAELLATLRKTWTGWAVLRALYDRRKNRRKEDQDVWIVPFSAQDRQDQPTAMAFTRAVNDADATARYQQGYRGGTDDPKTRRDDRYDRAPYQGTGVGSSSVIHFNPRGYQRPDCALLHELVHAVRNMSGVRDRIPTEHALYYYDNQEEFYPDVVEIAYLSERGEEDQIRFGHSKHKTMEEFLRAPIGAGVFAYADAPLTPAGLLTHMTLAKPIRRLLFKMTTETADMCENIAYKVRVTASWNLLREYMSNPAKYPIF
ncbi:MAG TPA: M91 family zinc metallopeptidase [Gemmataceae bacterium]|nr:M91 family zinc metallopeptidase [Gemmataceae bacterium]